MAGDVEGEGEGEGEDEVLGRGQQGSDRVPSFSLVAYRTDQPKYRGTRQSR